jgi:hypothetical protein|tara:strand:+ start:1167 stop:1736 length:570 start_codon:yes stop_codon:yes gene_type:complete
MVMKKIQDQIYSYKFPYTNIINKYKPSIIKKYSEEFDNRVKTGQPFSDFHFQDTDFTNEICPSLEKIVKNNWYTGNILVKQGLRVYIQTDAYFTSVFHSHEHLLGSIACVFYVNIPKEGGEIEFEYSGNKGPNGYNQIIKPEEDTIYFFPMWLPHRPLPHKDKNFTRLCFNWFYCCETRAQHKYFGDRW